MTPEIYLQGYFLLYPLVWNAFLDPCVIRGVGEEDSQCGQKIIGIVWSPDWEGNIFRDVLAITKESCSQIKKEKKNNYINVYSLLLNRKVKIVFKEDVPVCHKSEIIRQPTIPQKGKLSSYWNLLFRAWLQKQRLNIKQMFLGVFPYWLTPYFPHSERKNQTYLRSSLFRYSNLRTTHSRFF